jgi:uncharacterized protein (DUF58 family)
MKAPEPALFRRLELTVLRRVDGLLHGEYRGLLPAPGSEAADARPYVPGDDPRRIDWTVTARSLEPHVRDTEADRELEVTLIVDQSSSMSFGTALAEKRDVALEIGGAIALIAQRAGNRVGGVALGEKLEWVPPQRGRAAVHRLLKRWSIAPRSGHRVDLSDALRRAARLAKRRGYVVVISDFLDDSEWHRELRAISARHAVLAVEVVDPRELELPPVGVLGVIDPETGATRSVDTASAKLRARYADGAAAQRAEIAAAIARSRADHLVLRTDEDWVRALADHLIRRRVLAKSGGRR